MKIKTLDCLATGSDTRSINLLQNHQISLTWEYVTLQMRMADLLILDDALRSDMEDEDREWAATYVLSLNGQRLFIHEKDRYAFCALVHRAVERLPRRTVRWIDFEVTFSPYRAGTNVDLASNGGFSIN